MPDCNHASQPQAHGWAKTGSDARSYMEYYQRDNVSRDYSPTTGTVKTALDHPKQGKTQLIRRDLGERDLQKVLENPRAHTGHGFHPRK